MHTLSLTINQNDFDQILNGKKKQEKRELTPNNIAKFVLLDDEGYEILDQNENSVPINYDSIRFTVGNAKNGDTMLVEI